MPLIFAAFEPMHVLCIIFWQIKAYVLNFSKKLVNFFLRLSMAYIQ